MMNRLRSFVNADNETDVWECRQDCTTLQISSWNNEMDPSSVFIFDSHGDGPIETSMVTSQSHHDDLLYNCYYEGIPNLRSIMSEEESSVDSSSSSSASSPQSPNVRKSCRSGLRHSQDPDAGRVRFSSVQVREHSIMIGNHPCCRDSLPISLDWVHSDDLCFDIEDFEYSRNMAGGRGPRGNLPRMDFWSRRVRLQTVAGMSERDFIRAEQRRRQEAEREAMAYDSFRPEPIATPFPTVTVEKPMHFFVTKAKSDILESGYVGHKHRLSPCKYTEFGDVSCEGVTPASQYSGISTKHDKAAVLDAPWWSDQDDNTSVNTCHAQKGAKVSWADLVRSKKSERERAHNVNSGDNEHNNNSLDQESCSNRRGISRSEDSERYVERQESLG